VAKPSLSESSPEESRPSPSSLLPLAYALFFFRVAAALAAAALRLRVAAALRPAARRFLVCAAF